MLTRAGLSPDEAEAWESQIEDGAFLLGAHTDANGVASVLTTLKQNGATKVAVGTWSELND
jgi:hypothetical protein